MTTSVILKSWHFKHIVSLGTGCWREAWKVFPCQQVSSDEQAFIIARYRLCLAPFILLFKNSFNHNPVESDLGVKRFSK